MKPLNHAQASASRYGGHVDDYLPIHTFIDSSKSTFADVRHRAILHNSLGPFIAERVFGAYIKPRGSQLVSVRQVVEDHIVEDLGFIPSVERWLEGLPVVPWMDILSARKQRKTISWEEFENVD